MVLKAELRAYLLAWQAHCHLSYSASPFSVSYFWDRVSLYAEARLDGGPLGSWDDRCTPQYPATVWDGVSWTFCLGWPRTMIILIAASQRLQAWATVPSYIFVLFCFCSFFICLLFVRLSLNSGLQACKADALWLEPHFQSLIFIFNSKNFLLFCHCCLLFVFLLFIFWDLDRLHI
jgi:hypothetical protein